MSEAGQQYLHPARAVLYPDSHWPIINFEPHPERSLVANAYRHVLVTGEGRVGDATLVRYYDGDYYLTRLFIDKSNRGRGLGMAALIGAIELAEASGGGFRTDPRGEYPEVASLWDTLVEKKVAELIEPLEPNTGIGGSGPSALHHGLLRIRPIDELAQLTSTD